MKAIYKLNSDASVLSTSSGNKKWPSLSSEGTQKKDSDFAKAYAKAYVKVLPYWPYAVQF